MRVPRLLKLRMASLTCSRPAVSLAPALFLPPRPHARRRRGAPSSRPSLLCSTAVRGPRRASARPPERRSGAAVPGRGGDVVFDAAGARAEVGGRVGGHPHAGTVPHPLAQGH
jgi:hypothetical protein